MTDYYEIFVYQNADEIKDWCRENLEENDWYITLELGLSARIAFTEEAAVAYKLEWL